MKLAAYVWDWYLKTVDEHDADVLDIINIAFGHIRDGVLFFDKPHVPGEVARIHGLNPDMKILLSIGGWGAGGFSTMARTDKGIANFAASCADAVEKYGLDGIDLDWEYPTIDSAGIDADPSDKRNFTKLLTYLRKTLDKAYPDTHKMLTIAAGSGKYYVDATEMDKVAAVLDYVSLMTYDMRGAWSPAGHHTALYGEPSADESVKMFRDTGDPLRNTGVPAEKLMIGAAFYSRRWTNIPAGDRFGLGQYTDDPTDKENGMFGPGYAKLAEEYIDKNGYTAHFDEACGAPYLYNEEKRVFLSYDDERSVAAKVTYAKEKGLYGVMYWEHSSDGSRKLMNAMGKAK